MIGKGLVVGLVVWLGLAALWVISCSGPRISVSGVQMTPPAGPGEVYHVEATLHSTGPGQGQANVIFRLRNKASGETVETYQKAELDPGETTHVSANLQAPPADYEPQVEAIYPPR